MHDPIEMGEDPRGNAPALSIAGPKKKKMPSGIKASNKLPYTLDAVSRHEPLFPKDILELGIVVIGKFKVVCFFNKDPFPVCFPNTPTAGAFHFGKEFILVASKVNFKTAIEPVLNAKTAKIGFCRLSVHAFQMQTS
jgi:hypothetical protein